MSRIALIAALSCLACALALVLSACGGSGSSEPAKESASPPAKVRVLDGTEGAVISGVFAARKPADTQVLLFAVRDGRVRAPALAVAQLGDRGDFRFVSLEGGDYLLRAPGVSHKVHVAAAGSVSVRLRPAG